MEDKLKTSLETTSRIIVSLITLGLIIIQLIFSINVFSEYIKGNDESAGFLGFFIGIPLSFFLFIFSISSILKGKKLTKEENQQRSEAGKLVKNIGIVGIIMIIIPFILNPIAKILNQKADRNYYLKVKESNEPINKLLLETIRGPYKIIEIKSLQMASFKLPYLVLDAHLDPSVINAYKINPAYKDNPPKDQLMVYPANIDIEKSEEFYNFFSQNLINKNITVMLPEDFTTTSTDLLNSVKTISVHVRYPLPTDQFIFPVKQILMDGQSITEKFVFKSRTLDQIYNNLALYTKEQLQIDSSSAFDGGQVNLSLRRQNGNIITVFLKDKSCSDFRYCYPSSEQTLFKMRVYLNNFVTNKKVNVLLPTRDEFEKDTDIFNSMGIDYGINANPPNYVFTSRSVTLEDGTNLIEKLKSFVE